MWEVSDRKQYLMDITHLPLVLNDIDRVLREASVNIVIASATCFSVDGFVALVVGHNYWVYVCPHIQIT